MKNSNYDPWYGHFYWALLLLALTGINWLPAMEYMSEFSSLSENYWPLGFLTFVVLEGLILITIIMTVIKGINAVIMKMQYGYISMFICAFCIFCNLIPWIVNASVVFGFDFK